MRIPEAVETEKALLGSVLLEGPILKEIPDLSPEEFSRQPHKLIFSAMRKLYTDGKEITLANLDPFLAEDLRRCGSSIFYLSGLTDGLPYATPKVMREYAERIIEKATRRRAIKAAQETINRLVNNQDEPVCEIVLNEMREVMAHSEPTTSGIPLLVSAEAVLLWHMQADGVL